MQLNYIGKDNGSSAGHCPALYDAFNDVPGYAVQGKLPALKDDARPGFHVYGARLTDPADRAQLRDLDVDEDAVWVAAAELATAAVRDSEPIRPLADGEAVVWVPANVLDLSRTPAPA